MQLNFIYKILTFKLNVQILKNIFFSYAALPKALFNKTTNTWKPNPYDIPLNMHFCQPIFANEQNGDKDEIVAKRVGFLID